MTLELTNLQHPTSIFFPGFQSSSNVNNCVRLPCILFELSFRFKVMSLFSSDFLNLPQDSIKIVHIIVIVFVFGGFGGLVSNFSYRILRRRELIEEREMASLVEKSDSLTEDSIRQRIRQERDFCEDILIGIGAALAIPFVAFPIFNIDVNDFSKISNYVETVSLIGCYLIIIRVLFFIIKHVINVC